MKRSLRFFPMKKVLRMIIIVIVTTITLCVLAMCIGVFRKDNKVSPFCGCCELINKVPNFDWIVYFKIASSQKREGFFHAPKYFDAMEIKKIASETVINEINNVQDWLYNGESNNNAELKEQDVLSVLFLDEDVNQMVAGEIGDYDACFAVESGYVFSLVYEYEKREDTVHTALFYVYDEKNKEIVYLSRLSLNDVYCFWRTGKIEVIKFEPNNRE
ncbi:MAG: hypothetical protein J6U10_01070 [Lachnospiraceae bacterium]|nr:hypothetical protein [Lachnospiraceae bacterium]